MKKVLLIIILLLACLLSGCELINSSGNDDPKDEDIEDKDPSNQEEEKEEPNEEENNPTPNDVIIKVAIWERFVSEKIYKNLEEYFNKYSENNNLGTKIELVVFDSKDTQDTYYRVAAFVDAIQKSDVDLVLGGGDNISTTICESTSKPLDIYETPTSITISNQSRNVLILNRTSYLDNCNIFINYLSSPEGIKILSGEDMVQTLKFLFIGNSYTFRNRLPEIFNDLCLETNKKVEVEQITESSYYLESYADKNDTLGAKVYESLTTKKYDYVILQEQSVRPAGNNKDKFYEAVRVLNKLIRENGATPILYETWARHSSSGDLSKYGWTNKTMTEKLVQAYKTIGDELNIKVAHSGTSFYNVYSKYNDTIPLYYSDYSHPSVYGTYLSAITIYGTIFNESPIGLKYYSNVYRTDPLRDLNEEELLILQTEADKVIFNK